MEERKYELVMDDSIILDSILLGDAIKLYRIKALKDFDDVKTGDIGGYVMGYHNLSHEDDCWIYNNAKVYDNAKVSDKAIVSGNAEVYDYAEVQGSASVYGNARIFGNAKVMGNSGVYSNTNVYDDARIYGNANVIGNSRVYGNASVYDNAKVRDHSRVYESARIYGNAMIYDNAKIFNRADISSNSDYLYIRGLGSENGLTTVFKLSDGGVHINCGCFSGRLSEFEARVKETHGDNLYGREYKLYIQIIRDHFNLL